MTVVEPVNVPHKARLHAADFMLLAERGAFADYAKTELIEGEIWAVNAQYSRHAKAQARLHLLLAEALRRAGSTLETYIAASVALSDDNMPEPDIAIAEDHDEGPLPVSKVRLIVEVSDATRDIDLGRKAALYARHGVPEYWVADLEERVIWQMWEPGTEGYGRREKTAFGEQVRAMTIDGLTFSV